MPKINDYKDLVFWQKSMDLVEIIYKLTVTFPKDEQWNLVGQLRRAVISIPSNIAEGYGRHSAGDYKHFLCIGRGSLYELETQIILCQRLGYLAEAAVTQIKNEIQQIGKMLTVLISRL